MASQRAQMTDGLTQHLARCADEQDQKYAQIELLVKEAGIENLKILQQLDAAHADTVEQLNETINGLQLQAQTLRENVTGLEEQVHINAEVQGNSALGVVEDLVGRVKAQEALSGEFEAALNTSVDAMVGVKGEVKAVTAQLRAVAGDMALGIQQTQQDAGNMSRTNADRINELQEATNKLLSSASTAKGASAIVPQLEEVEASVNKVIVRTVEQDAALQQLNADLSTRLSTTDTRSEALAFELKRQLDELRLAVAG